MRSIKEICLLGVGPSSSHTIGPANACKYVLGKYKNIGQIIVILYGSLAKTGRGHLTDKIIDKVLSSVDHKIMFDEVKATEHPNTMDIITITEPFAFHKDRFVSIGGGTLVINGDRGSLPKEIYPEHNMAEILEYCEKNKMSLLDYVRKYEDAGIDDYYGIIVDAMANVATRGMESTENIMPGAYHLSRKAPHMYAEYEKLSREEKLANPLALMAIAAMGASEENACGKDVVCAPTCGSSGVLPGIIIYLLNQNIQREKIAEALMVGALIGIVCKQNGSSSGAECGCQAEVGVAAAIGAATLSAVYGLSNQKITMAAEMIIEHSLGLTCDAIEGRVQIPCIQRNALYAMKAYDAYLMAKITPPDLCMVTLDDVIKVMRRTGRDLDQGYKETAEKGLARLFREEKTTYEEMKKSEIKKYEKSQCIE